MRRVVLSNRAMKSIGLEVGSGRQPEREVGVALPTNAVDYCHLAEECFFLAAVARDPAAAAELVRAGDEYLQCAADQAPLAPAA
jgi:hypothetical protein